MQSSVLGVDPVQHTAHTSVSGDVSNRTAATDFCSISRLTSAIMAEAVMTVALAPEITQYTRSKLCKNGFKEHKRK